MDKKATFGRPGIPPEGFLAPLEFNDPEAVNLSIVDWFNALTGDDKSVVLKYLDDKKEQIRKEKEIEKAKEKLSRQQPTDSGAYALSVNKNLSERGRHWLIFAGLVLQHIEEYTVPQYGDFPNDSVANWTPAECMSSIKRYVARFGRNSRAGQDELDLFKIAHFAQIIHMLMIESFQKEIK